MKIQSGEPNLVKIASLAARNLLLSRLGCRLKMVALAESFAPEKASPEPKTRVWDFFGGARDRVGESASQAVDRVWVIELRIYDSRRSPSLRRSNNRSLARQMMEDGVGTVLSRKFDAAKDRFRENISNIEAPRLSPAGREIVGLYEEIGGGLANTVVEIPVQFVASGAYTIGSLGQLFEPASNEMGMLAESLSQVQSGRGDVDSAIMTGSLILYSGSLLGSAVGDGSLTNWGSEQLYWSNQRLKAALDIEDPDG